MSTIRELRTVTEWKAAFPVMNQLRTDLDEETYLELVMQATRNESYHLFAVFEGNYLVAVTGFMPMTTLYSGPSVWVCDLVTDQQYRSQDYGGQLLQFIEQWAMDHGYSSVLLSSESQHESAYHFYMEKMEFDRSGHVFKKVIES
ncbi:GNAT family N-acetyltransferase [Sporolactobacillus nakayamae]|uniref:Acetyltransferase (GNAT) domain-containing protein n=1 Tax=Sporolactobacillus nakayamae TaxID=269670 RepID=A0A1I2N2X8_9BACL|nr:GNAT family N-acetyltransferase [Sporolactobacillus nakayamae]SFF98112.1 Acetyltransferase (GNAT) domain-containing protein [Sporolactobacillus nakayamae]